MTKRSLSALILLLSLAVLIPQQGTSNAAPQAVPTRSIFIPLIAAPVERAPIPTEWIGPGGGVITALIFDPEDPNTAYAAAWGSGIYKSSDGGRTWRRSSQGLIDFDVTTIEVAPANPLILFAGTYRGTIYKSVDAGASWFPSGAGLQEGMIPYAIEVDPRNSARIYLATRGISNNGNAPWRGIVYRSEDGGKSWQPVLTNVGGAGQQDWAYDLAIYRWDPRRVYAATHEHGAYRSQDFGASWQAINNGVSDLSTRAIEPDMRKNTALVYLGVFHPRGVFKSLNWGDSWNIKTQGVSQARVYRLVINPNNKDTLYLATFDHGVLRSTDAGESWSPAGLSTETILALAPRPAHYSTLLSGTLENGLFRSVDNGVRWAHSQQGLNASSVTGIVVPLSNADTLYASLNPGWISRSTDGGATWEDFQQGITDKRIHALVAHPHNPNLLYALSDSGGLFRRDALVDSQWQSVGNNLPAALPQSAQVARPPLHDDDVFQRLFPDDPQPARTAPQAAAIPLLTLAFAPTTPAIGYLGTAGGGVFRTLDDGISWAPAGLSGFSVYSLIVVPGEPTHLYAATNGGVYESLDGGANWSNLGIDGVTPYALALDASTTLFAATSNGIYRYERGNSAWNPLGLSGMSVTTLATHPIRPGWLYAGTNDGAFRSTDGGATWQRTPTELEGIGIQAIYFDPNNPRQIYYATKAHGILRAGE